MDTARLVLIHQLMPMLADSRYMPYALRRLQLIVKPESESATALHSTLVQIERLLDEAIKREDVKNGGWYRFTAAEQRQADALRHEFERAVSSICYLDHELK